MTMFKHGLMALAAGGFAAAVLVAASPAMEPLKNSVALKAASSFDSIRDKNARSVALFQEAGKVINSPRCMNCHPAGERPTQTDKMSPHQPLVVRGPDGHGPVGGLACATCHHDTNFDPANVPGNPKWGVAPLEMAWQGKSLGQICEQIKDTTRNGGKNLEEIVKHMGEDSLVGWAWEPGGNRIPAPGTQREFGDIIKAWAATGASCPKS
jgi:hypothetical protein